MKALFMAMAFVVSSCSTTMDSLSLLSTNKVTRMKHDQKDYKKPEFYLMNSKKFLGTRAPASLKSITKNDEKYKPVSNRQLYFISFYKQQRVLEGLLGLKKHQKSCPRFHDFLLKADVEAEIIASQYTTKLNFSPVQKDPEHVAFFPILSTPYSQNKDLFTALRENDWKDAESMTREALYVHYQNNQKELFELCETGVSSGYYLYENLVTYFKNNQKFHQSQESIAALLKIPVIANMFILKSLKPLDENIKTLGLENHEVSLLKRSEVDWFKSYMSYLERKRIYSYKKITAFK
ncbi:MAG: hypothetical protein QF441_10410 [Bacteriovoracaceae bacterium]|jgi:hypothetical protein|nr:hypothetical protein [Halobacteriovoraceae bacterium]MDP7321012.1 hypothetical protein [Bacteriovoracaceae bacterium]